MGDLEGMLFPGFTLTRSGKEWQLDNLAGEEKTDSKAAADLAARVSGLTVQSVVEAETAAPLFVGEPALRFSVKKEGGAQIDYLLAKGDEETYYLKQSERAQYGKVHKLQAEGLLKAGREALIAKPEEPGASGNDKVEGDTGGK